MSLSKKEIAAIAQDSTTFYLYKDYVTSNDLIKIIRNVPTAHPAFMLLPIIKTIAEYNINILTDEVKYELLYKIGVVRNKYTDLQQIVDMFRMYKISVPNNMPSKIIEDILLSQNDSPVDKDCQIWAVINCMKPKLTKQTIETIMATPLFCAHSKMLEYILNQLVADKDFNFILEQKELFTYASKNKPELAKQIVKNAFNAKQLDVIVKQSKAYHALENGVLFSDDLIEQMIALCMKEHKANLIFDIYRVFNYVTNNKPELAKQALKQLFEDKKEEYISSNPKVLSYILKHEPEFLKILSAKKKTMEMVKPEQTLDLLNKMPLPNADLEFTYIKRNNKADVQFPPKEKLSPETQDYISIITGEKVKDVALFKRLSARVISALIDCRFNNQADWYKIIEQLLIANPNLDVKFVQQILNRDKRAEVLIKRHWKGSFRKLLIKELKQTLISMFKTNQKQH